jgi:hypothetical protein
MPSGLVTEQHGMRSGRHHGGDLGQMPVHRRDVAARQNESRALAVLGTDRAKEIGRSGTLIVRGHRPGAAFRPAPGDLVLLSNARFILKPDLYPLACGLVLRDVLHTRGEVFLKASRAAGSWA